MERETEQLENRLRTVARHMAAAGDHAGAGKMTELAEKWTSGECYIVFCGHFSAGKSSLINKLCGGTLLPSRPTPASANVVAVRGGAPAAFACKRKPGRPVSAFGEGDSRRPVPFGELDRICLDGEDTVRVDIHYPIPILQRYNMVWLDTPGIDSTDERHREATGSALHLADAVFYVSDYNHVQSELNLVGLRDGCAVSANPVLPDCQPGGQASGGRTVFCGVSAVGRRHFSRLGRHARRHCVHVGEAGTSSAS